MLLAGMHDPVAFKNPSEFCPYSRKVRDHLHFGAGPHECVGRRMAELQLEEITAALFSRRFMTIARPRCSRIHYDDAAVVDLRLC